jgi:hypothetical protein
MLYEPIERDREENSNMKNIMILLIVFCAAYFVWKERQEAADRALNPEVIENPMYADVRVDMEFRGRSIEGVLLAKVSDQADCQRYFKEVEKLMPQYQGGANGPTWKMKSSECKSELAPRYLKLFDNTPTSVTYLSFARGDRHERELRLVYWGITVDESDKACTLVSQAQRSWKGAVTCIRASR